MIITLNYLGEFFYKSIADIVKYFNTNCFKNSFKKKREDQVQKKENGRNVASKKSEKNQNCRKESENNNNNNTIDQNSMDTEEIGGTDDLIKGDSNEGIMNSVEEGKVTIPIKVALIITIGWVFFCAALFQLWEDWTYGESWYFMFISMMVFCFVFVIVGLSLVSMCFNVIKNALKDLYKQMLMKLLTEYHAAMSEGGDQKSASIKMMKNWGKSQKDQLLIKLTNKNRRNKVMNEIKEMAKDAGIELPPIFESLNGAKNKLFNASKDDDKNSGTMSMIDKESNSSKISNKSPSTTVVRRDAITQTDICLLNKSNNKKTISSESANSGVQREEGLSTILSIQ
uniref:Uncharacterized protein n=1 Tax=Panagrolaimus superbus TaxID=310955 RepID=A0A914YAS7_9BILA